jgi:tRNA-specific 2-thiouridylase
VADVREEFKQVIVKYFVEEYMQGRTPNPCVMCNPLFKERLLCEWADKTGCAWISTGHYCRLEEHNGYLYIIAGDDATKDQSYFLWRLPQEVLRRFLFPLGNYTKQEVREYLREKGFEEKAKGGESMEVCFIEGDYRDFLRQQIPDMDAKIGPGFFVDSKGVKIGQHRGFPYYTIGQRKGLGIALGHPAHVLRINAEKNTVMLGTAEDLKAEYMLVEDALITDRQELLEHPNLTVRIHYRSKPIPCKVIALEDNRLLVKFLGEASAIAPGQSAVFYDGRRMLGGAFIASQRGIYKIIADTNF